MKLQASFRDPAGYLYRSQGALLRQVAAAGAESLSVLTESGLYETLTQKSLLVEHSEVDVSRAHDPSDCAAVLEPVELPVISYPYEWSFSQLKDAALLTLQIQELALAHGASLKDASAFNVQFHNGRPIFIDTLSFEPYQEGRPWVAYRQFCQHFLGPLALMSKVDVGLSSLFLRYLDGIPLDLVSRVLPRSTYLSPGLLTHVHLHSRSQKKHSATEKDVDAPAADAGTKGPEESKRARTPSVSLRGLQGILASLRGTVKSLDWNPTGTEWIDYYQGDHNYEAEALSLKEELVVKLLGEESLDQVWDLGANVGRFSRAAARDVAKQVVAWDIDPACVEAHYRSLRKTGVGNVLPLVLDLTNPTPAIGWANEERGSLFNRRTPDALLALGLIHHLAISNNVPLAQILGFFKQLAPTAVVEWIPKSDSQVRRLLRSREDIFPAYTEEGFESAASTDFDIVARMPIEGTERVLYRLERR